MSRCCCYSRYTTHPTAISPGARGAFKSAPARARHRAPSTWHDSCAVHVARLVRRPRANLSTRQVDAAEAAAAREGGMGGGVCR